MGVLAGTRGESGAAFNSTHWSVVLQCAQESSPDDVRRCRTALETLCRDYWPPLYSCVRRRGHPPAEAQDLVQNFFVHLLETRAYAKADPARGKFRTFLLASLQNFLANAHNYAGRRKRGGDQTFVLLEAHLAEAEAAALVAADGEVTADRLFEQRWAASILHHAWESLRLETEDAGRGELLHTLRPYLMVGATPPPSQEEVAARLGLPLATLRTHIHRLRTRFRSALRAEVARTMPAEANVDEELLHLRRTLLREVNAN
jgi:RNA polymerase sigma factor (sigma-70 family)